MATAAQIAANRRNARHSTGPRGLAGRERSAQNARRDGLTAQPDAREVAAAYLEIAGRALPADPSAVDARALRLAAAEVRLSSARCLERDLLANGCEDLRELPDVRHLLDFIEEAAQGRASLPPDRRSRALSLAARLRSLGGRGPEAAFRRMRRHLLAAEREHAAALSDWTAGP